MPKDAAQSLAHLDAFTSRRRDPASKREAVLKTAAELFLETSYSRTSMNDVADRLSITKPALYHYFRNKEEILIECYRLGTGLIEEILNDIATHCGTGLEKVEAFIYSYANVMTVNFGRCVMRLDDADLSSDAVTQVRNYKRKIDRRLRSFIQEEIRRRLNHGLRCQNRGLFDRWSAQLDLSLVRAGRRPFGGRDRDSIRAHPDARISGEEEAKWSALSTGATPVRYGRKCGTRFDPRWASTRPTRRQAANSRQPTNWKVTRSH